MSQLAEGPTQVRVWDVDRSELRHAPFAGGPAVRTVVDGDPAAPIAVLEVTMPVGGAMPEHEHGDSFVLLAPLAGRFRLVEEGADRSIEVEPGALATIPVGRQVRLENAGEVEARTLVVLTPPDFAQRLRAWPA
jgi:quercetin dioxygenase-like cupin family protein